MDPNKIQRVLPPKRPENPPIADGIRDKCAGGELPAPETAARSIFIF